MFLKANKVVNVIRYAYFKRIFQKKELQEHIRS